MASRAALGRLPAPLIAVAAAGAGLPVGLVAVAWIALDGWGAYRDRYHLGHLLGAAVVTLFVLSVAGVALGLAIGRRGWLAGLLAWPVVAVGIPSLVGADSDAARLAALLIAAGSAGAAVLAGVVGVDVRRRAWTRAGIAAAALVVVGLVFVIAGGLLAGPPPA